MTWLPDKTDMLIVLGGITFAALCTDLARSRVQWISTFFAQYFDSMLRDHELSGKLTGATWVMIGAVLTIFLFPKPIAITALVFMSLGDTVAGLIGKQFGRIKIGLKSLEGTLSGLAVCVLFVWLMPLVPLQVGVMGAVTAMAVELLPIPIDDNLSIPLSSGTIMFLISNFPA